MKQLLLLLFITLLGGCSVFTPLRKTQVISVFHLIEAGKYNEAKGVVEDMKDAPASSNWSSTWYARGFLCQSAYREGMRKNDKKLMELYPDQLYEAYTSYQKAMELPHSKRLLKQLAPRYVLLVNDFQSLGESHFGRRQYDEALRAFNAAIEILTGEVLVRPVDTGLVYNAALAAYEASNWSEAVRHLETLHNWRYAPAISHLLFDAYMAMDRISNAESLLRESIRSYSENTSLVLLLADMHLQLNQPLQAIMVLDSAITSDPNSAIFYSSKGLILQKSEAFNEAILAYEAAIRLAPDEPMNYINIATCHYNIGVGIDESARLISNISAVQRERERSASAYKLAVEWLDRLFGKQVEDKQVLVKMQQLYRNLRVMDKVEAIEQMLKS